MDARATQYFQRAVGVSRPVSALVALAILLAARPLAAQQGEYRDRVVLDRDGGGRIAVDACRILDYTARTITLSVRGGEAINTYPASQVVSVETPQTEPHVRGLQQFRTGGYREAEAALEEALQEESGRSGREWVRRELLALLVRCALARGDVAKARSRFVILVKSEPQTRHFGIIPLTWAPQPVGKSEAIEGRGLLGREEEPARLIGASLLLQSSQYAEIARNELDKLAASPDARVRSLAVAQRWRLRLGEGELSADDLRFWQSTIETMPAEVRGGPYFLLGQGYLRRQEYDRAAAALLWVPLVYDEDAELAARACVAAGEALARIGKQAEAASLFREVTQRFPQTSFAQDAASLLKERP